MSEAELIKYYRTKAGMTQGELSKILGYTNAQFVSNWERGLSSPPPPIIKHLCVALKIPTKKFLKLKVSEYQKFLEGVVL